MIAELRKIVHEATKEQGLQMEVELKIVDNLGRSEQWFVNTYNKLRDMCGQRLHHIDFKNY